MFTLKAEIQIIVGNPYVSVPEDVLKGLFAQAGKDKGHIPIKGTINGKEYKQTLVKYSGQWRLYINMEMLKNSPRRIGEVVHLTVVFDPADRTLAPHPKLARALEANPEAKAVFDGLSKSIRQEIIRYISFLKTESSIDRNVDRAISFLLGKGRFVGRNLP